MMKINIIQTIPLFRRFPVLGEKIPRISLGDLPTPVDELIDLGRRLGAGGRLFVKRDDLSGRTYGGNKVRKLEFLLGEAVHKNKKEVLTFGGAGSNHALATAIYSKQLGIGCILMLFRQHNSHHLRENLLLDLHFGAELHHGETIAALSGASMMQVIIHALKRGRIPMVIPPGGSSPLGATGFVNAAFEIKEQIDAGMIPEPDYLYVALGSNGTAAGLILGAKVAGLKTKIIPVRVTDVTFANEGTLEGLIRKTNLFLNSRDSSFPVYDISTNDLNINHAFFGKEYGLFTKESIDAVKLLRENGGIILESTYSGKAFAALIDDSKKGMLSGKTVLFWDTFNSRDLSVEIQSVDYRKLPVRFQEYFTGDVQELDRA